MGVLILVLSCRSRLGAVVLYRTINIALKVTLMDKLSNIRNINTGPAAYSDIVTPEKVPMVDKVFGNHDSSFGIDWLRILGILAHLKVR